MYDFEEMDVSNVEVRNLLQREEDALKRWIKTEEEIVRVMEEEADQAEQRLLKLLEFREGRWSINNSQKSPKRSTARASKENTATGSGMKLERRSQSSISPVASVSEPDYNVENVAKERRPSQDEQNEESNGTAEIVEQVNSQEEKRQLELSRQRTSFPMVKIEKMDWFERENSPSLVKTYSKDSRKDINKKKENCKLSPLVLHVDANHTSSEPCLKQTNKGKPKTVLLKRSLTGQFVPVKRCTRKSLQDEQDMLQELRDSKIPRYSTNSDGECRGLGS